MLEQHVAADEVARIRQGAGPVCHIEHQVLKASCVTSSQPLLHLDHEPYCLTEVHWPEIVAEGVIGKIPNIHGLVFVTRAASVLTEEQIDTVCSASKRKA